MSEKPNLSLIENVIELSLLVANEPLTINSFKKIIDDEDIDNDNIRQAIKNLQTTWQNRAFKLIESAGGYQLISHADYQPYLRRLNPQRPPKFSRSMLEVLSIIIYQQPVTRGDIEKLRGIAVSNSQISFLEELHWIEAVGQKPTPGRPTLYATTKTLLDDLGLISFDELPTLENLDDIINENTNTTVAE